METEVQSVVDAIHLLTYAVGTVGLILTIVGIGIIHVIEKIVHEIKNSP